MTMWNNDEDDTRIYTALVNDEGQYSLWPKEKVVPAGWTRIDFEGSKQDVMKHIDEIWTDMRPASLRRQMDSLAERKSG
jgi:MbtH protein